MGKGCEEVYGGIAFGRGKCLRGLVEKGGMRGSV